MVYKFVKKIPEGKHVISTRRVFSSKRNDVEVITKY